MRQRSGTVGWLSLIVLIAMALRLLRLGSLGDLEFDEIVSVRYAALPPGELLPALAGALFEHPPVYYLLLGAWLTLTGSPAATEAGDLMARTLSVFPGTLLVPLTFALGRRTFDNRVGLYAAMAVALGPLTLFYSREARMYELVACLAACVSWLFLRAADRHTSIGRWSTFAAIGAISVLVHYAGLLIVLAQPVAALFAGHAMRRRLLPGLAATCVVLIAAGVWAATSTGVRGSLPAIDVRNAAAIPAAIWQVWQETAAGPETTSWRRAVAGGSLAALVGIGLAHVTPRSGPIVLSLAGGLSALGIAVALGKPAQARYILVAAPFIAILAGRALSTGQSRERWLSGGCAAGVLALGVFPWSAEYYTTYRRADYGAITAQIAAHERSGDAVLLTGPWQAWYFDYLYPRAGGAIAHRVLPEDAPPALDPAVAERELRTIATANRRLWLVQAGLAQADPTNSVERWLRRNAWPALREPHRNGVLSLYALAPPETRRPLRPTGFGGLLNLTGGWVDGDEVSAGDVVRVALEVEVSGRIQRALKGSLRLVGADGQRLSDDFDLVDTERDNRPATSWEPGERVTVRQGVWIPVTANPQPYDVRLVVYDAATLAPLPPRGTQTTSLGDAGEAAVGGVYITQTRAQLPPPTGGYSAVDRTFGGGEEFDAFQLVGTRWHQASPSSAPLNLDLVWRIDGASGTLHRSVLAVRDARGAVWIEDDVPMFSGSFFMHDWRPGETLGERRAIDLTSLPAGAFTLTVRVLDERGRRLPVGVEAPGGEVALRRFVLPYRPALGERLAGAWRRIANRVGLAP